MDPCWTWTPLSSSPAVIGLVVLLIRLREDFVFVVARPDQLQKPFVWAFTSCSHMTEVSLRLAVSEDNDKNVFAPFQGLDHPMCFVRFQAGDSTQP